MVKLPAVPHPPSTDLPKVSDELFQIPFNIACIGKRGQGKSSFACRLLKSYGNSITDIFVISPTVQSQLFLFQTYLGLPSENLFEVTNSAGAKAAMQEIICKVQGMYDMYKEYKAYKHAYRKFIDSKELTALEERLLMNNECREPPAHAPRRPSPCIVFDDMQSLDRFMTSSYFVSFVLRHRHIAGSISILSLLQTLKGCSRSVRQNLSGIVCFSTHDETALDDISRECSAHVPRDHFKKLFRQATEQPHSALCINLTCKDKNKRFSRDLEQFYPLEG